jgi:hypothetical protein
MEMVDLEANKGIQGAGAPGYFAVYATACLLFPASFQVGTIFNYWHLPIISGYLVTGVRALSARKPHSWIHPVTASHNQRNQV